MNGYPGSAHRQAAEPLRKREQASTVNRPETLFVAGASVRSDMGLSEHPLCYMSQGA